jgi:hypothetical protein
MLVVRHQLHYRNLLTVLAYVRLWGSRHETIGYAFPIATDIELVTWKGMLKAKGWTEENIAKTYSALLYVKITHEQNNKT